MLTTVYDLCSYMFLDRVYCGWQNSFWLNFCFVFQLEFSLICFVLNGHEEP